MRILDRQRYWAFLKAYVICFTSLVSLNVVIDAFSNFDEFTKRATGASQLFQAMGRFYLVHMSEFYDRLCGVIGMMAAIFTVTWMQKNNELLAMLAAGISTQRVIRPVIISSIIVSGLAIANQEFIMPDLSDELQRSHDDDGTRSVYKLSSREDGNSILFHGLEANRNAKTILNFNATIPSTVYGTLRELEARQATFIAPDDPSTPMRGGWLLRGSKLTPMLEPEFTESGPLTKLENANGFPPLIGDMKELGGETYFLRTSVDFRAMTRSRRWYQFATTADLIQGLTDPSNRAEKLDISVFLHGRILRPLLGLALLFVTLPQVLNGYGRNMFVNLGLSLGMAALFYGLNFMSQYLGTHSVVSPELAAWAPLIGFGTFAAARWGGIRT